MAKHAAATRLRHHAGSDADGVRLVVRDDGVGILAGAIGRTDGHLG